MSVIIVPEGAYSDSTLMYNSLVSQGYFGWSTAPYSRRVICCSFYSELVWLSVNSTNVSTVNSIFNSSIPTNTTFLGIIFANISGEYQFANNQDGTINPSIDTRPITAHTIYTRDYFCQYVSTGNTGLTFDATGIYNVSKFDTLSDALDAISIRPISSNYPITYRLTNCTAPDAPSEASIGSTVTVPFVFPDGYGIVNNENVYVTNNGVIVPSTYSDGVLTFEMPNPG